jgi:hypothetical protein
MRTIKSTKRTGSRKRKPRANFPATPQTLPVAARRTREPVAADAMAVRIVEIDTTIDVLKQAVARLAAMPSGDVAALALAERQSRARTLCDANLAIEDLENAKLVVLNDAFESRRPDLARATSGLADDLSRLQDAVAFIGAAAAAVGIVADVVAVIS